MNQGKEFKIKVEIMQAVVNYLVTKPYQESAQLIKIMSELPPLDNGPTVESVKKI